MRSFPGPQLGRHRRRRGGAVSGLKMATSGLYPTLKSPECSLGMSSQAETDGDGSGAILGARSAEQGSTSANGQGLSVAVPSVKKRRNGSFRTCCRDLQIRRLDRDKRGLPRILPAPDDSACTLQGDHEQQGRADWLTAATSLFRKLRILGYELRERSPAPDGCA
jgi:hypothetical protein